MNTFIHAVCGFDIEIEHDQVREGAPVTCVCGTNGSIYIEADDEGFPFADVSWQPMSPEALEAFDDLVVRGLVS
jgi:hypothetical protein